MEQVYKQESMKGINKIKAQTITSPMIQQSNRTRFHVLSSTEEMHRALTTHLLSTTQQLILMTSLEVKNS